MTRDEILGDDDFEDSGLLLLPLCSRKVALTLVKGTSRDEIEKLSDDDLNLMVATEVMGWEWTNLSEDKILVPPLDDSRISWATEWDAEGIPRYLPDYSTDIAAAMQVVYEMNARNFWFMCGIFSTYCYAQFGPSETDRIHRFEAGINELPRAISIASLLAKMQP